MKFLENGSRPQPPTSRHLIHGTDHVGVRRQRERQRERERETEGRTHIHIYAQRNTCTHTTHTLRASTISSTAPIMSVCVSVCVVWDHRIEHEYHLRDRERAREIAREREGGGRERASKRDTHTHTHTHIFCCASFFVPLSLLFLDAMVPREERETVSGPT